MRPILALMVTIPMVLALTAASCGNTRPAPPEREVVVQPEIVTVEVPVYLPLDSALTEDCNDVADGPNSAVFAINAQQRAALAECTARMREIREMQGKRVDLD
jgi:hypothetical protein